MCGIAGILYADRDRPVDQVRLRAMAAALADRGPDAEGVWTAPGVGLAHRRLSIIDLAGSVQPLGNEDGSIQVTFNGEIYNYQSIRDELIARGHSLRTHGDTETLVHLYEDLGDELVGRLRGMFAFAMWDASRSRLLLARDRVGQKPLYIYRDGEKLLFASQLKAILAYGQVDRAIDPCAVEDYLAYGVIPGRRSIFRRIEKLPSAHVLSVSHGDWDRAARRYWRLELEPDEDRSLDQWLEAVEAKFDETVQAHTVADVPVGAFLSGGVDSSGVVASLAASGGPQVQTFSIGFQEESYSELPYARRVAQRFGTRHVEEIVTAEAVESLDDLVRCYDEPFADASAIPTMRVAQVARRHVKVVLSGDGGDEAFGGYARYAHDLREASYRRRLPQWLRRHILGNAARLWPKSDWLPRPLRAKTALTNLSLEPDAAYANTLSSCRQPLRRGLLTGDVRQQLNGYEPERLFRESYAAPDDDPLRGMIGVDVSVLLPDDFLTKVDRASMGFGLEVRPPLVDHELLELAARIPSRWKVREGETKWLLKEVFSRRLPDDVVRRPKMGFEIPLDAWFRGSLGEAFESAVLSPTSAVGALVDQPAAAKLLHRHRQGVARHGAVLWSLLVLARWMDEYAGQPPVRAAELGLVS